MIKLNVGCGGDVRKNWINLDNHDANGADVIFDLNEIYKGNKMPFPDNHFDYVYCSHVLEDFVEPVPIMDELVRVCKVGGEIEIRTPFETNVWTTNIYHKKAFTLGMFENYIEDPNYNRKKNLTIVKLEYNCEKGEKTYIVNFFKFFIEKFYNLFPFHFVEMTCLKYLFPVINCKVIYKKEEMRANNKRRI